MDTQRALYKSIIDNPDEDTVRLEYADWLDEQPTTKPCPKCRRGEPGIRCHRCHAVVRYEDEHHSGEDYDGTWVCNRVDKCKLCDGTGTVPDTSATDRAELIRVQCRIESAVTLSDFKGGLGHTLFEREKQLLDRYREEWSRLTCPACGGAGIFVEAEDRKARITSRCETCGGTGDLLRQGPTITEPRPHQHRRGFLAEVSCTLAECGSERDVRCGSCSGSGWVSDEVREEYYGRIGKHVMVPPTRECTACSRRGTVRRWVPSAWARAVVRAAPVMMLRPADVRFDVLFNTVTKRDDWRCDDTRVPIPLRAAVHRADPHTERAASDALARTLATLARTSCT